MKVVIFDNNFRKDAKSDKSPAWYLVADSALSNVGKPFYLPGDYGAVTASLGLALKCSKLGKSISSNFAKRYYHEYAPVVHFRLENLKQKLSEEGYPFSAAVSFDRSVMAGDWRELPANPEEINLYLKLNGEERSQICYEDIIIKPEKLIEEYSRLNTIKMGDIIIPGMSEGIVIQEKDYIEVSSSLSQEFTVKVR